MDPDIVGADIGGDTASLSPAAALDPSRAILAPLATSTQPTPTPLPAPIAIRSIAQPPEPVEPQVDLAPPRPVQLAQAAPQARPGTGQGLYGSNALPISPYAGANADPLDVEIQNLTAQRDQYQAWAAKPFNQFWERDKANQYLQEATKLSGQIQEKEQQKQTQQTNQQAAHNMGLTKPMPRTSDAAAIREEAVNEWKNEGNYDAYRGLVGAGDPRAELYMSEGINALGKKVTAASDIYAKLGTAKTQQDYMSLRKEALSKGKDYATYGLTEDKLPKTLKEFQDREAQITGKMNDMKVFVATYNQKQAQYGQQIPISDDKIAAPVKATKQFSNGEAIPNTNAVTFPALGGMPGAQAQSNSSDLANYGAGGSNGFSNATPAQVKTQQEQMNTEQSKGAIGQYKMAKTFHNAAYNNELYKYPAGVAFLADELGAIGRDVAEGSKAAGSIGLVKILETKYGTFDNALNAMANNAAAYKAWLQSGRQGKEVKLEPRLTPQSIEGFKAVADFKLGETKNELSRVTGIDTAGRYGIPLDKLGLDKETQALLKDVHGEGLLQARLDMDKYPSIVKGDTRTFLAKDAVVPANTPGFVPAGSYAKTLASIPNSPPPLPSSPPPATTTPPPSGSGGDRAATSGGPATPPAATRNPVAATVYNSAGQTATNMSGGNAAVGKNVASIVASSAASESGFRPNEIHDGGIGQGLFGHNAERLAAMQKFAGVPVTGKPGAPIPPDVQAKFFTRELMDAAEKDPFIKKTINDPNASPEDLARVQVRLERPQGYTGPGSEEKASGWRNRLASTREMMTGGGVVSGGTVTAEANVPAPGFLTRVNQMLTQGVRGSGPQGRATSQEASRAAVAPVVAMAPGVGGTVGAIGGGLAGAPLGPAGVIGGGLVGAGAGGAAGGALSEYLEKPEGERNYGPAMGYGAARGAVAAVPGGPIVGPLARMGLSGAISGGEKYLEGGTTPEIVNATAGGILGAAGGEMFGAALGMTFSKIYKAFSGADKAAVQDAAKVLSEQKPKTMLADGSTVENTAYTAAEKAIKDRGIDPEFAAHAYEQVAKKATRGEAFAGRPGETARARAGAELEDIKNQVGEAGAAAQVTPRSPTPGAPFKPIPGGPVDSVLTGPTGKGTVPAAYMPEAAQAEFMLQKPAAHMGERWANAAKAREDLLKQERTARIAGDTTKEEAMRTIADTVRNQQEKMVRSLLPKQLADRLVGHLKASDNAYREAVLAGGDDIVKTIAKGDSAGNQAKAAFNKLAVNDPTAQNMVNALVRAENRRAHGAGLGVLAGATTALHFVPVVGTAASTVSGVLTVTKAGQMLKDYMVQRGAGRLVTFKELVLKDLAPMKARLRQSGAAIGGAAGAEAANSLAQ